MPVTVADLQVTLDELCASLPAVARLGKRASVFGRLQYSDLDDEGKCHLAAFYLQEACPNIGAAMVNPDVPTFLRAVIEEAQVWPDGTPNNNRRLEHILFAMETCRGFAFATSPGAMAATYLLTQLEYIFRLLGRHLDANGKFKTPADRSHANCALGQTLPNGIYRIQQTYRIMLLNPTCSAVRYFASLDCVLPKPTIPNGNTLSYIGDRLAYMRDPAAHGARPDISCEGLFYSLLMAMILVGSSFFERKV